MTTKTQKLKYKVDDEGYTVIKLVDQPFLHEQFTVLDIGFCETSPILVPKENVSIMTKGEAIRSMYECTRNLNCGPKTISEINVETNDHFLIRKEGEAYHVDDASYTEYLPKGDYFETKYTNKQKTKYGKTYTERKIVRPPSPACITVSYGVSGGTYYHYMYILIPLTFENNEKVDYRTDNVFVLH